MAPFKIGDKILCVDFSGGSGNILLKKGSSTIHTITKIELDNDSFSGDRWYVTLSVASERFFADRFILVKSSYKNLPKVAL